LQSRERSVVEEGRLQGYISQWRAAELVSIRWVPADLLEPEVLIPPRSVEDDVALPDAELRRDLWHADYVHLEVAEHLVGLSAHGVADYASRLSEEQQRAPLLGNAHRAVLAAREAVDGRVGENECELKLGDGAAKHREVDRPSRGDARQQ